MKGWLRVVFTAAMVLCFAAPAYSLAPSSELSSSRAAATPYLVSHPYIAKDKIKHGRPFRVWGYVTPAPSKVADATLTVVVQRWRTDGLGSWLATPGNDMTAALSTARKSKSRTNYATVLAIASVGRYRMCATLRRFDSKGAAHLLKSPWKYFRLVE